MKENVFPFVSVVIPTYGRPAYLLRAITSVLLQNYPNFEVVVVDDNKPGTSERAETERIIKKLSSNKVVYIQHETNRNGSAARNTGIRYSKGDYIAFLDDDDEFKEDKIRRQLDFMAANQFAASYCMAEVYKEGNLFKVSEFRKNGYLQKEILSLQFEANTSCLMFEKKAICEIGGFDESFVRHQDYELLLRYMRHYPIYCCDEYLIKRHSGNIENLPTYEKLRKIKADFFLKFREDMSSMSDGDKKIIHKAHGIELSRFAFREKRYAATMMHLLLSGVGAKDLFGLARKCIKIRKG